MLLIVQVRHYHVVLAIQTKNQTISLFRLMEKNSTSMITKINLISARVKEKPRMIDLYR